MDEPIKKTVKISLDKFRKQELRSVTSK